MMAQIIIFLNGVVGHERAPDSRTQFLRTCRLLPIFIPLLTLQVSCAQNPPTPNVQNSAIEIISEQGTAGIALIVYHPGFSDFQEKVTSSFAQGLVDAKWQVDRSTTARATIIDLTKYDLLAIGANTYWWNVDRQTRRFLSKSTIPKNTQVIGLITAIGASGRAEKKLHEGIKEAGGVAIYINSFWTMRPNDVEDTRPNREVAIDKAYRMGKTITSVMK